MARRRPAPGVWRRHRPAGRRCRRDPDASRRRGAHVPLGQHRVSRHRPARRGRILAGARMAGTPGLVRRGAPRPARAGSRGLARRLASRGARRASHRARRRCARSTSSDFVRYTVRAGVRSGRRRRARQRFAPRPRRRRACRSRPRGATPRRWSSGPPAWHRTPGCWPRRSSRIAASSRRPRAPSTRSPCRRQRRGPSGPRPRAWRAVSGIQVVADPLVLLYHRVAAHGDDPLASDGLAGSLRSAARGARRRAGRPSPSTRSWRTRLPNQPSPSPSTTGTPTSSTRLWPRSRRPASPSRSLSAADTSAPARHSGGTRWRGRSALRPPMQAPLELVARRRDAHVARSRSGRTGRRVPLGRSVASREASRGDRGRAAARSGDGRAPATCSPRLPRTGP